MESSFSRYKDILDLYRENLSRMGMDRIEEQLKRMRSRGESWDSEFAQALAAEIKKRGQSIDLKNYKIIHHL